MTFAERLRRRYALWWGTAGRWWTLRGFLLRVHRRGLRHVHRGGEMQILRRHTDPDHAWRFARYWQRVLLNKFNSREFARRHGCRVPRLYWHGRRIAALPVDSLPERYVVRPIVGAASRRVVVVVDDQELMTGTRLVKAELRDRLIAEFGEIAPEPLLLEEFVRSPGRESALPLEYKVHVFGDRIAAIEVQMRTARKELVQRQFDSDWKPLPQPLHTRVTPGGSFAPPDCLDELMAVVRRLGTAFGTYVRVDCYVTEAGTVFGEFSSTPGVGKDHTPYGDAYMGRLWAEIYPRGV